MKQLRPLLFLSYLVISLLFLNSCSPSWSGTFHSGSVSQQQFSESLNMEIIKGLTIIPVEINGKTYRFLFDTGAVNSISEELQEELGFKVVSKGKIKDSDNNRSRVIYVNVDTLSVGGIEFYNQSSFVGDFKANPVLRCMNLDGILGSNVMRFCNWTIDYEKQEMVLSNQEFEESAKETFSIPFETDIQYNQLIELNIGDKTISKVKIDYGSNGYLSIPNDVFKALKEDNLIQQTTFEHGVSQAGIVGKVIQKREEITVVDSLYFEDIKFRNVVLADGGSGLLGSKIFSNWIITIDWEQKLLHFQAQENQKTDPATFGFGIGFSESSGVYTQTIIEGGPAEFIGLKPKMKILSIDDITFDNEDDFCKFLYLDYKKDVIDIEFENFDGNILKEKIIKQKYSLK